MKKWSIIAAVCAVVVSPAMARALGLPAETAARIAADNAEAAARTNGDNTLQNQVNTLQNAIAGKAGVRADGPCYKTYYDPSSTTLHPYRYVDCGNGTVTDTTTGLIWLKQAACLSYATWHNAQTEAAGLANGACGLTDGSQAGDWRLPTKDEWSAMFGPAALGGVLLCSPSLTNDQGTGCLYPGPSSFAFVDVASNFWSGTASNLLGLAYLANIGGNGSVDFYDETHLWGVWPVRVGPR
jgi:hypothetical protein